MKRKQRFDALQKAPMPFPEPKSNFEIIKNMSLDEMADGLLFMLYDIIEDGIPSSETVKEWLSEKPKKD